ncbi:autoinducer binding domain-containing protein [Acinetobacter baumannii]
MHFIPSTVWRFAHVMSEWTSRYMRSRYELIDPVITQALQTAEPFQWCRDLERKAPSAAAPRYFGYRVHH